jgi:D-alanine transaminase
MEQRMIVFFNHQFIPKKDVRISPDDRGFLLADGAYEVIISYRGKLFKAGEHIARMERSLRYLQIRMPDGIDFVDIASKLVKENDLQDQDATIYFQVTRGAAQRTHAFPEETIPATVYASASAVQRPRKKQKEGVRVILVPDTRWARCDIKSIALLPNVLANQRAKEEGVEEAIFVRNGAATEGSHTNFCGVFGNELRTAPKSNYILAGITRDVVLNLCKKFNITVKEFPIFENQLKKADELMIVGTSTEIMPIVRVDDWQVGNGEPGPITRKLQKAFNSLTKK